MTRADAAAMQAAKAAMVETLRVAQRASQDAVAEAAAAVNERNAQGLAHFRDGFRDPVR